MASRVQQDQFMDDSDDACPLCVEEFDLSDKNFRPCPCGYQVCQFCYNNIKNNLNGLCPACRRPYDEKTIEWKIISPEEFKADVALQARKKAAARQKEAERRQVETLNRKHLAGLRVVQKNLVYVVGLNPKIREEDLLQTLRGDQYFGQYGKILKIVVSKAKPGADNKSIGVYVTFARKQDAATCIAAVDGSQNGDRVLRAQYGTTKYCSAYLRNEQCNNRECMFLHETGDDSDSFSRQDLSSMNAVSTQRPASTSSSSKARDHNPPQSQPPPKETPAPLAAAVPSSVRQASTSEAMSRSDSGDGSALPTTASWAKHPQIQPSRRSSLSTGRDTPSPRVSLAKVETHASPEPRLPPTAPVPAMEPIAESEVQEGPSQPPSRPESEAEAKEIQPEISLDRALKTVMSSTFDWSLDRTIYDEETLNLIDNYPQLIDVTGGYTRIALRAQHDRERLKQEEEQNILQTMSTTEDEDNLASGSLQLGGEPETQDSHEDSSAQMLNGQRGYLQQRNFGPLSGVTQPFDPDRALANDFSSLGFTGRSMTPQQQQHLMLLKSNNQQHEPIFDQFPKTVSGNTSQHQPQLSNPFQTQNLLPGHARQGSRYTFANDTPSASTVVKPATNERLLAQQAAMMPLSQNKYNIQSQQHTAPGLHTNFYSGIQGPPPGLKSSGTPPISGGGMFGQGHGFASAMGGALDFRGGNKNSNDDLVRDLFRGRNGVGGGLGSEAGKREFMFPLFLQKPTTSTTTTPAPGLPSSLYGSQHGAFNGYHDQGSSKQKKKGKKHRHANTSSSGGGGIVDLADPSILQARMHHGGAGQGPYGGGQGQESQIALPLEKENLPTISSSSRRTTDGPTEQQADENRFRSRTSISKPIPVPPGLSFPHDFPPLAPPTAQLDPEPIKTLQKVATGHTTIPATPILSSKPIQPSSVKRSTTESGKATKPIAAGKPADKDTSASESSKDKETVVTEDSSTDNPKIAPVASSDSITPTKVVSKVAGESTDSAQQDKSPKSSEKRQRPGKLDIAAAKDATKKDLDFVAVSLQQNRPATPSKTAKPDSAPLSQPTTPPTAMSQASASPAPRQVQQRTIRVVQTPKVESPLRMPATGTFSTIQSAPASKPVSRKASLSSIYQPGTPLNETISDNASYTSASLSRPGSPPPSKVGYAPVRQNTKSQQKKERQERARVAEEKKKEEAAMTAVPEEPVQAPIIGRKKKTKKANTGVSESGAADSRSSSPKPNEGVVTESQSSIPTTPIKETKKSAKAARKEMSGASQSAANPRDTNPSNAPKIGSNGEALLKTLQNTAAAIFAELQRSGQIPANSIDLFKSIPAINYRLDISESDPSESSKMPTLTDSQRQQLEQGEAICVETGSDRRVVILPDRRIQRGFSREQAERYLTLRKSMMVASGPGCFHPARRNIEPWLNAPAPALPPFEGGDQRDSSAYPAPDNMDSNFGELEYTNHFDLPMTRTGPAGTSYWSTGNNGANNGEENMPVRVASMSVEEAEKKWMESKRDTESHEKKLNAVIKKNRRLLIGAGH